ncbi:AraC family transcriptional regulator [Xanthomonas arboricola]|nr:AraC family transcriptional regulator [Xanthomonas arboricola]PPU10359.1 AraC family transcriptional regulator [Xanthomonas arboricola]PPU47849.1 AraC family transcriptional regulator [Xanthomonas arboricola]
MVKLPATIVQAAASIAQSDGDFPTSLPGLSVHRRSAPAMPMPCIYGLGLGLTLQGGKQVMLGEEVFDFAPGNSLLTTVDLPVVTHVSSATREEPFLGMLIGLDAQMVLEEVACLDLHPLPKNFAYRPISLQPLDAPLVDALLRLIKLASEPRLINSLAPLIRRELTVRLLTGPHGPHLRHVVASGTPSQQIARVMGWLKQNFHRSFSMEELASSANMSPSTFRQHFREIASMSPLQYQKQLRLQEARQLMLNEEMDAGVAGIRVGYESPSQFSREYARLFGAPPLKDIRRLRLS